jgi:cytosine permease
VNAVLVALGTGLLSTWIYFSGASLTSIGALDSLFISLAFYTALELATRRFNERTRP